MKRQIRSAVSVLLAAAVIVSGSGMSVQAGIRREEPAGWEMDLEERAGSAVSASSSNAEYGLETGRPATPGNAWTQEWYEVEETVLQDDTALRSSRKSNVLVLTGKGNHEMMQSKLGKPGVYLLFQGANYRAGFKTMISDHTTDGSSRQLDGIWEYYPMNSAKEVKNLETRIWKGTGAYSNAELVKVADGITIQNTTDTDSGNWETTVTITNPHPKLTGVMFYYYAPHLEDYGGVVLFPITPQTKVEGAAEAHTHSGISRTEPTCTKPGSISGRCDMCGDLQEEIPALGHSLPGAYDTSSVPGYKIKNCTRCGERLETVANTYRVAYNGNGATGGSMEESRQTVGKAFSLEKNQFTRTGYRFTGWNTQGSGAGTGYQEGQSVKDLTLTDGETVQLYAQWKANTYTVTFDPNGGTCQEERRTVTFDGVYGELPVPEKEDCRFLGWTAEGGTETVTAETVYRTAGDSVLTASWELIAEDLGNGTNRRPGPDGELGTADDHYYYNGADRKAGTGDDLLLSAGDDGQYGTGDDFYSDKSGTQIHAGLDTVFDTADDYVDNGDGTNRRAGADLAWNIGDDEYWWNGEDQKPGTEDDRKIEPGLDGEYKTADDFVDNSDGTNRRTGADSRFGTEDDELWWNGEDGIPGTADDKEIHPGLDGEYGTEDDYIDNGDGTHTRPGEDGKFGTEDDEKWWNGEDGVPGTADDKEIHPGPDGEYGTEDDYIDNGDGTNTRPGEDGQFGTEDDEIWQNGEDGKPGTADDSQKPDGAGEESKPGGDTGNGSGGSSGGNSSGGGGSSGGGNISGGGSHGGNSSGGPGVSGNIVSVGKGKTGTWEKLPEGWVFNYTGGGRAKNEWDYLYYGVTGRTDWYRFGEDEYMETGWYQDSDGEWYFLHNISDGTLGHMKTGWYLDTNGRWYYLNPVSDGHRGAMFTGWHMIDGKWYYFNPVSDGTKGAMYAGCVTPDGYLVGADGAWIQY